MTDSESVRPEPVRRRHRPVPPGTDHLVYAVPDLPAAGRDLEALPGARQTPGRPLPRQGIIPFFIDWGDTPHPCAQLPDMGVRLVRLFGRHPDPEAVRRDLHRLGVGLEVTAGRARLVAVLETRAGDRVTL